MQILGFNKTTLLDYPGHLAATIFLGGCNFRCPFCHNKDLVLNPGSVPSISDDEVFLYLKKRRSILEGVCITGGEPTLNQELEPFIKKIKELDLEVKLDTNGYRPQVIKKLNDDGLLDFVAMDIKTTRSKYASVSGFPDLNIDLIDESIKYIINNIPNHQFRTTVVKELHTPEDIKEIATWIKGAKEYHLQSYRESEGVINPIFTSYSEKEFNALKELI